MSYVKFIHTADLHLDTPFKGLLQINKDLADKIKNATFKAFEKIIDTCISEKVDFLLIAGDIFDREYKSLGAQLKFIEQLTRLSRVNIATYFICGNHDPLCSWLSQLDLPDKVYRFSSKEVEKVVFSKNREPLVDIYGISYQDKAITENISLRYQIADLKSTFSIAMLHGNLGSESTHGNYAPFTLSDLKNSNFDYWALGHIHSRQVISQKSPVIIYPGNPQGRDFGEKGSKGCYLVELQTGYDPKLSFIPTQLIKFEEITVDLTDINQLTALNDAITNSIESDLHNDNTIIRVTLAGRTPLHYQLIAADSQVSILEQLNTDAFNQTPFRFVDSIRINTKPDLNIEQLRNGGDFLAELIREFDNIEKDPAMASEGISTLVNEMANLQLKRELPALEENDKNEIIADAKYELLENFITA
jgi:DNA repair exonuclease SbcCD nuclease subunit